MIRICSTPAVQIARGHWISERWKRGAPITLLGNPKWRPRAWKTVMASQFCQGQSYKASRAVCRDQAICSNSNSHLLNTSVCPGPRQLCYNDPTWYIVFSLQTTAHGIRKSIENIWWYIWKNICLHMVCEISLSH